jgi:hypothetical protein
LKQALESFEDVQQLEPGFRDTEEILSRLRRALAPPPRVEVPDLAGRSISQARSILANEGLELSVYEEVPSDTIPEGEVIEQCPDPGTELEAGGFVSITVSTGPHEVIATAPPGDRAREDTNRLDRAQPPASSKHWQQVGAVTERPGAGCLRTAAAHRHQHRKWSIPVVRRPIDSR